MICRFVGLIDLTPKSFLGEIMLAKIKIPKSFP